MSVLQSELFASYQFMVPVISHATKTHKPEKVIDPRTKEEVERCSLYPSIPCSVHEARPPLDIDGTPATFVLAPDGSVIFGVEEMRKAYALGPTLKKLEEAQKKIGPGLANAAYMKALKDLADIDADIAAEKIEKAIRSVKKMLDGKSLPAAMKESRVKAKLDEIEAKGRERLDEAKAKRDAEPDAALAMAKKVASQWKGMEAGKAAAELVKEWEAK